MVRLASGAAATYLILGRGHLSGSADERSLDRVGAGGVRPPAATAIESRVGSTCPGAEVAQPVTMEDLSGEVV